MVTCSLQSGSCGNATYVEACGVRLLFDAGVSALQVRQRLAVHGHDARRLDALILSHRHQDHIRGAGVCHRLLNVPLYATPATEHALRPTAGKLRDVRSFTAGSTLDFGAVRVHTLPTPHDAAESVAFIIEAEGKRLGILTDLGHVFPALRSVIPTLDAAYLESNYDEDMLAHGPYPESLKERIRGRGGHISNAESAEVLRGALFQPQWVMLAHLSAENNTPATALRTHRTALGAEFPLHVASRTTVSPLLAV
ncbi:MAG: MBL fold metallo-hydrolase [Phycisphaerales bacterium]|nr:MBL fold metallo-hydrolase [Phycisphaerales bacterium]